MNICKLAKKPKVFSCLFGITPEKFKELTKELEPCWLLAEYQRKTARKRKVDVGGGRRYKLSFEQMTAMYLLYARTYMSHIFLGELFRIDDSRVCRYFKKLEPVLHQQMKKNAIKKINLSEEEILKLVVDATEQETERRDGSGYSGKKKRQTIKTQIVVNIKGQIKHISHSVPGNIHDKKLYDQTKLKLPPDSLGDLGFVGIPITLPNKSSKFQKLTKKQKKQNKQHSTIRIVVEHVFAHLKKWKMLSNRFRNALVTYNQKFTIIAGLYNLKYL